MLVGVLKIAYEFIERRQGSAHEGVRRTVAEAELTVQVIREWLNQDPSSIAISFESLALSLNEEKDPRMRHIRLSALHSAARLRLKHEIDVSHARDLLGMVVSEAREWAPGRALYYAATLEIADLALEDGVHSSEALADAFSALEHERDLDLRELRFHCRHLEQILDRLPAPERDEASISQWTPLIDRYASHEDPQLRVSVLEWVRYRKMEAKEFTSSDVKILQHADAVAFEDTHPDTEVARFHVAALLIEVFGRPEDKLRPADAPCPDPVLAVKLSQDLERRFPQAPSHPELSVPMLRVCVDRALRLEEIGRLEEALDLLSNLGPRFKDTPASGARHLFAQAQYWRGRLSREAGKQSQARYSLEAVVEEFSEDQDPDVRVWAANALFSAWRSQEADPAEAEALFDQFLGIFSHDSDLRIRRHEASGRLNQAVRAYEAGKSDFALQTLRNLVQNFETEEDAEIAGTVRLARENLEVLSLSSAAPAMGANTATAQYAQLRDQFYAAEEHYDAGEHEQAVQEWRNLTEETAGSNDPNILVLRFAALDMWGGYLEETKKWLELVSIAQQGMLRHENLDFRGERLRARAYLRFGTAQSLIGDVNSALKAYETLDALVADVSDDEVMSTRQQGVYNRAVLMDGFSSPKESLEAYDHAIAVHALSQDSSARRLRRVKALRNKAQILNDLGNLQEATRTHHQILEIAVANPDVELSQRARLSAFSLADCYRKLGDHASVVRTYAWIRSQHGLGFDKTEMRSAAKAQKAAEREAKRHKR